MTVPFLDLKATYTELQPDIDAAVARVLNSGWYIGGGEVDAFENAYAHYCQADHCVGVANGLDALHLALLAMGVGPGDEVIVPSNTYIATWLAVSQCGATVVPVEPSISTHNLDVTLVEAAMTSRTKVILPVHLYGQPVDLDPLLALAKRHGVWVLEDGAQAHGARYKGQRIGAHGDAVAWSFYPGKNLGAFGDGGAVTTNNADIADRLRVLRNYGSRVKYVNEVQGFNSRLDPLHAAVLAVKLQHLDAWNARRVHIAQRYAHALSSTHGVLPETPAWADPAWHLYVVRTQHRAALQAHLQANGIGTLIHYPIPPHLQEAYAGAGFAASDFPIATQLANEVVSLPMGPHLLDDQVSQVIEAFNAFDPHSPNT